MVQKMKAKDRRTFVVMVRINRRERITLRQLAKDNGMSMAALLRMALLGAEVAA